MVHLRMNHRVVGFEPFLSMWVPKSSSNEVPSPNSQQLDHSSIPHIIMEVPMLVHTNYSFETIAI